MNYPFTWRGQPHRLHKHPEALGQFKAGKLTADQLAARPWYLRLTVDGTRRLVRLGDHRTPEALAMAKRLLAQRAEDGNALAGALAGLRPQAVTYPTMRQIVDLMLVAPVDTTRHTRAGYISGTKVFLETTLGTVPSWDSHTVDVLTPDLVYRYRAAVHARGQAEGWDDARRARAGRSGNSVLRDIRSLFTPGLQEFYRIAHKLTLPDLVAFREAPGFRGATKTSSQYRRPSDALLARTLAELQAGRDTHRARFVLVWLALGFGLRKSEAAAVRCGWCREIGGRIHIELRAVVEPGSITESSMTKNGEVCPVIPCANGAWQHLGPLLAGQPPESYAVPATSATERRDSHFRDISTWLKALGWETGKQYHEFRALAGAWYYDAVRDLYRTSRWMRHSSVTVTEQAYGRYNATDSPDVPSPAFTAALAAAGAARSGAGSADTNGDTHGDTDEGIAQAGLNRDNLALFDRVSTGDDVAKTVPFPTVTRECVSTEGVMRP